MCETFKSAYRKYLTAIRHGWRTSSWGSDGVFLEHKNGRGRCFHLAFDGSIITIPF